MAFSANGIVRSEREHMATVKEHEQEIDGKLYRCKTFPASEGLVILPKIVSLLGDKVANLVFAAGEEGAQKLMDDRKIMTTVMVNIAERAEENDGLLVLRDLMRYTVYVRKHQEKPSQENPKPAVVEIPEKVADNFDTHFAADYMHLLRVAMWVGRASFGNPG